MRKTYLIFIWSFAQSSEPPEAGAEEGLRSNYLDVIFILDFAFWTTVLCSRSRLFRIRFTHLLLLWTFLIQQSVAGCLQEILKHKSIVYLFVSYLCRRAPSDIVEVNELTHNIRSGSDLILCSEFCSETTGRLHCRETLRLFMLLLSKYPWHFSCFLYLFFLQWTVKRRPNF